MHEMQTIVIDVHSVYLSVNPSGCLSQMHRMTSHSEADLRLGLTVRDHSVQPLPNYFGLLFYICRS